MDEIEVYDEDIIDVEAEDVLILEYVGGILLFIITCIGGSSLILHLVSNIITTPTAERTMIMNWFMSK
jgi:hypothetical protein